MLLTFNHWHEYKKVGKQQKFSQDGTAHITLSNRTLKHLLTPWISDAFPIYHASKPKPHHTNDHILFPNFFPCIHLLTLE